MNSASPTTDPRQVRARPIGLRLALAALLPMLVVGCFQSEEPAPVVVDEPHIGWGIYSTRALVLELPVDGGGIKLRHEAIPNFLSIQGELVGMQPMRMLFPLGEGVSIEGIEVGDKVEFSFEVDWDPGFFIVSISGLPSETELDFSKIELPTIYETGP